MSKISDMTSFQKEIDDQPSHEQAFEPLTKGEEMGYTFGTLANLVQ